MDAENRKAYRKLTKEELIENIDQLNGNCEYWATKYREMKEAAATPALTLPSPFWGWKFGSVSFDFWPPSDWVRFSYNGWGPGKYAQLTVGPLRVDWAEG